LILSKIDNREEALFYMESAIKQAWSRNILLHFIKADSYKNAKLLPKANNFKKALPEAMQEQANEILKSSYSLDLLGITKPLKDVNKPIGIAEYKLHLPTKQIKELISEEINRK